MDRRRFHRTLFGALGAALGATTARDVFTAVFDPPRVDGARLGAQLEALARFGRNELGGVTRVAYTEADRQAREYVMRLMREASLEVTIDAAANLVGRRAGTEPGLPPLLMGSHIDTVPEGGKYDGTVGSIGAIEVARTLAEHGVRLRHPLEVLVFQNEEHGSNGSRALSQAFTEADLAVVNASGKTRREGIAYLGGDPDRLDTVRRAPGSIAAYLELHIEQSGVLEEKRIDIGVVEGIVGINRWSVTVTGEANHAGATPMDRRRDALLAASMFVVAVNRIVTSEPGRQVATVGRIEASPGAPNVIAGRAVLTLELRDLDRAKALRLFGEIEREARERIAPATGTTFGFEPFYDKPPALTDARIRELIAESARELGLATHAMPSAAGHDSQYIAPLGPIGMIFIPSAGGISHSADEYSRPADIANGADVLLRTLLKLDARVRA